MMSTKFLPRFF